MSVFTIDLARQFVDNAFRSRPKQFRSADEQKRSGKAHRPLLGKDKELLEALRAGEQRYRECKAEIEVIRLLRKSDAELPRQCTATANSLQEITEALSRLDRISREELNSIALYQGSSFDEMYERLEKVLCCINEGTESFFLIARKRQDENLVSARGCSAHSIRGTRKGTEEFSAPHRAYLRL